MLFIKTINIIKKENIVAEKHSIVLSSNFSLIALLLLHLCHCKPVAIFYRCLLSLTASQIFICLKKSETNNLTGNH